MKKHFEDLLEIYGNFAQAAQTQREKISLFSQNLNVLFTACYHRLSFPENTDNNGLFRLKRFCSRSLFAVLQHEKVVKCCTNQPAKTLSSLLVVCAVLLWSKFA